MPEHTDGQNDETNDRHDVKSSTPTRKSNELTRNVWRARKL